MENYLYILIPFLILDIVLKAITLWKSARKSQKAWFLCLLFLNTAGILPLIYLALNKDDKKYIA